MIGSNSPKHVRRSSFNDTVDRTGASLLRVPVCDLQPSEVTRENHAARPHALTPASQDRGMASSFSIAVSRRCLLDRRTPATRLIGIGEARLASRRASRNCRSAFLRETQTGNTYDAAQERHSSQPHTKPASTRRPTSKPPSVVEPRLRILRSQKRGRSTSSPKPGLWENSSSFPDRPNQPVSKHPSKRTP